MCIRDSHEAHADYPALHHALDDWLLDRASAEAARVDNPNRLYWGSGAGSAG